MITCSIRKRNRRLLVDLHSSGYAFTDFLSFWDLVLQKTRHYDLWTIELIHGLGQGCDGAFDLATYFADKLSDQKEILYLEPMPLNRGLTIIHLKARRRIKMQKNNLKQLFRDLQAEEKIKKTPPPKAEIQPQKPSDILNPLLKILETEWNEAEVKKAVARLKETGRHKEVDQLLKEIQIYEIFFSEDFRRFYIQLNNEVSF